MYQRIISNTISNVLRQPNRSLRLFRERTVRAMYWRGRSLDKVQYQKPERSDYIEWNYRSELFAFSRRLQENLSEDTLRKIFALQESNEDLIKEGDQLLINYLDILLKLNFNKLPSEGIRAIRDYLTSEQVISHIATWLGCKDLKKENLSQTLSALIAGIERDLGSERAKKFVADFVLSYLEDKNILDDVWIIPEPREYLRSLGYAYEPRILFQTGIKTLEPCHIVGLYVDQKLIGSSAGETLKIAEDCAALDSIKKILDLDDDRPPLRYDL